MLSDLYVIKLQIRQKNPGNKLPGFLISDHSTIEQEFSEPDYSLLGNILL
jgi:hypothetical protein